MKYTIKKLFIIIFCSVFMLIGANSMFSVYSSGGAGPAYIFGGMFFFVGLFIMVFSVRQLSKFQNMTYEWYKTTNPGNVKGNSVTCDSCGNSKILVRNLMNKTFHRAHFCAQCGKTLYYSPEM